MTEAQVIARITTVLASPAAQKIDFQLDGIRFVGSQFSQVSSALMVRQVGKRLPLIGDKSGIAVSFGTPRTKGAAAEYIAALNVVVFPSAQTNATFAQTAEERSLIVHECVHAWCDLRVPSVSNRIVTTAARVMMMTPGLAMTKLTSEALAYVAGALYYLYDTAAAGGKSGTSPLVDLDGIYGEAFRIAL